MVRTAYLEDIARMSKIRKKHESKRNGKFVGIPSKLVILIKAFEKGIVDVTVEQPFSISFPSKRIKIKKKRMSATAIHISRVASFLLASAILMAFADNDTFKELSETSIEYAQVPDVVKNSFENTKYGDWDKQEIEKVKTNKGTRYEIEVASADGRSYGLYFTPGGELDHKEEEEEENEEDEDNRK